MFDKPPYTYPYCASCGRCMSTVRRRTVVWKDHTTGALYYSRFRNTADRRCVVESCAMFNVTVHAEKSLPGKAATR